MRILLLTESLGCGGAERQICTLAKCFQDQGHGVRVVTYSPGDHFLPFLQAHEIPHCYLGGKGRLDWLWRIRRVLRQGWQDVVLAFLGGPSAYAEIAGLPLRRWGLVVSERSIIPNKLLSYKCLLYNCADYIVLNSHASRLALQTRTFVPRRKLATIYNAVDVNERERVSRANPSGSIRFIVAARIGPEKNALGLLQALNLLRDVLHPGKLEVHWYGNQSSHPRLFADLCRERDRLNLASTIRFFPPTSDIHSAMAHSDAVILPSFFEGLPNAVCEGMVLGKPILMSAISDAQILVEDGQNGYLFDPTNPQSIAAALRRFMALSDESRQAMERTSQAKGLHLFDPETICRHYLKVLAAAAEGKRVAIEHWPPNESGRGATPAEELNCRHSADTPSRKTP